MSDDLLIFVHIPKSAGTFLRDPVARVIADYYKILRTPGNEFHERATRQSVAL
ncbi:MAG TPA: hypothetical protein VN700_13185 [Vicinamibacterales bacterium]|nr:hypothetical protein [Vicinamibacterales bacterium]